MLGCCVVIVLAVSVGFRITAVVYGCALRALHRHGVLTRRACSMVAPVSTLPITGRFAVAGRMVDNLMNRATSEYEIFKAAADQNDVKKLKSLLDAGKGRFECL